MLVSGTGVLCGSIGGGRVEQEVTHSAQGVARGGGVELVKHNLVQDLAMCCGGTMELFIEPFGDCEGLLSELLAKRSQRTPCLLQTNLTGGGKRLLPAQDDSPVAWRDGDLFSETILPAPRVLLFGCGHLARAIGPLAAGLDFEVVLCDDNATGAVDTSPEWATAVVPSFALRDVEKSLHRLGPRDYLLILTRDHAIDQRIIEETLARVADFDYVGLIGSLGKVGRFRKRVLAKGKVSEEQWQALHAPIGLDICAETPQEIAVSIMAELVALKNAGRRP
jgi:xanthine dehydrogenase accessory factor